MMVRFGEAGKEFENTYMVALYFPCIFFREGVFVVAMVPVLYVGTSLTHFTARKRSLRRLCFHRCLSVHGGVFGLCPGGSPLGGVVSIQGGLCPGGLCPGDLCPGASRSRGVSVREMPNTVTSGQYASYWNALLCYVDFCFVVRDIVYGLSPG